MRQGYLKRMLEEIGRFVLWSAARAHGKTPEWSEDEWQVTAVFPELVSKDVTKFATAMQSLVGSVVQMIDADLMTQETALKIVADVAQRFGQEFDAKTELEAARQEAAERKKKRQEEDSFNLPADLRAALAAGRAGTSAGTLPGQNVPAPAPVPENAQ
jgi:hypothetical protein